MSNAKKMIIKSVSLLLIVVCAAFIISNPAQYTTKVIAAAVKDSTVQGYEDRLSNLKKEQDRLKKEIADAQKNAAGQKKEKEALDKEIQNLNDQILTINALITVCSDQITEKETSIAQKEQELEEKFEQFKDRMRISYEEGKLGYLAMLFSSESISDFLTGLERMTNILEYDKKVMKEINDAKALLNDEKAELEKTKADLQLVYDELNAKEDEVQAKVAEVSKLITSYEKAEQDAYDDYIAALNQQKKEEEALEKYLKELAEKDQSKYTQGQLSWPVKASSPKYDLITSKYGNRTYYIYGRWVSDFHLGVDIGVQYQPVYAAADGTIDTATTNGGSYGKYITINHGGGYTTRYAHLDSLSVKVGQKVTRGQQIGVTGNTGNSSGPHLHFEVRINGATVNPLSNGYVAYPKSLRYW